jgi:hypothetical protein
VPGGTTDWNNLVQITTPVAGDNAGQVYLDFSDHAATCYETENTLLDLFDRTCSDYWDNGYGGANSIACDAMANGVNGFDYTNCCACGGGTDTGRCTDYDGGSTVTDPSGIACAAYTRDMCGNDDGDGTTNLFVAEDMCCICKRTTKGSKYFEDYDGMTPDGTGVLLDLTVVVTVTTPDTWYVQSDTGTWPLSDSKEFHVTIMEPCTSKDITFASYANTLT